MERPEDLSVELPFPSDDCTVEWAGEIDLATADQLAERLRPVLDTGAADVIVDLGAVTFLDSTGLRVLLSARRRLEADGRQLHVRNPSRSVQRVFVLSGLDELVEPARQATLA